MKKISKSASALNIALTVVTVLFVIGGFDVSHYPDRQKEQGDLVRHSQQVLNRLDTLALHITEAETGQRGYLLTAGQDKYLQPYLAAAAKIDGDLDSLSKLASGDARQTAAVSALRKSAHDKLAELQETVDLRKKTGDNTGPLKIVMTGRGRDLMTQVTGQIAAMKTEQESALQVQTGTWQRAANRSRAAFLAGEFALYVLVCGIFLALQRAADQRRKLAETEARAAAIQRAEAARLAQIVAIQRDIAGSSQNLKGAMEIITGRIRDLTRAEGAIVEMMDGDELVYRAAGGSAAPFIGLRLKPGNSLSGLSVREGAIFKCDDSETDPRVDRDACRKIGLRSMVVAPLRHKGQPVGVLKILSAHERAFGGEDVATLELMSGFLSGTISDALAADALRSANEKLEIANIGLEELASTDGLTGLKNHRVFKELLAREFGRALRYDKPLSLILLDVDHFKTFNDTFGHPEGDAVLKRVAAILRETGRMTDFTARYGGEEFAILLPETAAEGADVIAERIRQAVERDLWEKRKITVSIGVSSFHDGVADGAALLDAADKALYISKKQGRNRVTHYAKASENRQATA